MNSPQDDQRLGLSESLRASLMMLAFGLTILAFLVAIDRPHWFKIHPVSGAAAAMSNASSGGMAQAAGRP